MKKNKAKKSVTFDSLCKMLNEKPEMGAYIDDIKLLVEVAGVLFGNPEGGSLVAFFATLAEKSKLFDLGKKVLEKVLKLKTSNYAERINLMREVYGLVYYTAFFDTIDNKLPEAIRRSISLMNSEKNALFNTSNNSSAYIRSEDMGIIFPDLVFGFTEVEKQLSEMYTLMAGRLREFVCNLSFWEKANEKEIKTFDDMIKDLPNSAIKRFHNQYLILCNKFNEFYIFLQIEQKKEFEIKCDNQYKALINTATRIQDTAEAGLLDLEKAIKEIPKREKQEQVQVITNELINKNKKNIKLRLIETGLDSDSDEDNDKDDEVLVFPPIEKAFIPQPFKLLKYIDKSIHLEMSSTWAEYDTHQDMTSFWAKYLSDPDSIDNILLILGEPGAGKSLLTKVITARLSSQSSIVIRIPLRNHNIDDGIESIICNQIEEDGDASNSIPSFKWFADEFDDDAITLIFDGYDEVQQATGVEYRNFLVDVKRFQRECLENGRPVRVVVTSRDTLIDKAVIPYETQIMKLLEFDKTRKEQWASIWNEYNHGVLSSVGLNDFALPTNDKDIDEISGQPLLLLMLAIYDADFENKTNAIRKSDENAIKLDRTRLYDELLRRFIRRELRKGPRGNEIDYYNQDENGKTEMVDNEMRKLGIAALGMLVREKMSIKVSELEVDFNRMKASVTKYENKSKKLLNNAEVFFGSFFFVHDPRSTSNETDSHKDFEANESKEASFEFLHKTFYEFLVADLTLECLLETVERLMDLQTAKNGNTYYNQSLKTPSDFQRTFFSALDGACICSEPEIIRMIAEWKNSKIDKHFADQNVHDRNEKVYSILSDVFNSHAEMIRNGTFEQKTLTEGSLILNRPFPQSCAIYLMNLHTMRILLSEECKVDADKWYYISQYIKLNLPLPKRIGKPSNNKKKFNFEINPSEEMLLRFVSQFKITRSDDDKSISFSIRNEIIEFDKKDLLEARMEVLDFMQDDVTRKLYALHSSNEALLAKQQYREELINKGMDLSFERLICDNKQKAIDNVYISVGEMISFLENGRDLLLRSRYDPILIQDWFICIDKSLGMLKADPDLLVSDYQYYLFRAWLEVCRIIPAYNTAINDDLFAEITKKLIVLSNTFIRPNSRQGRDVFDFLERVFDIAFRIENDKAFVEIIGQILDIKYKFVLHGFRGNDSIETRFYRYYQKNKSPRIAAYLLKLNMIINDREGKSPEVIWAKIERDLYSFLVYDNKGLPELLRMGIRIGEIESVHHFLQSIDYHNDILERHASDQLLADLISIAKAVKATRFLQSINQHSINLNDPKSGITVRNTIYSILCKKSLSKNSTNSIVHFLEKFDIMLMESVEDSIDLLYRIVISNYFQEYTEIRLWCSRASEYATTRYFNIVEISKKSAVYLLIILHKTRKLILKNEHIFEEERMDRSIYLLSIQRCFDSILADNDRSYSGLLFKLLDDLDIAETQELRDYFKKRIPYLRIYNRTLSNAIEEKYDLYL